IQYLSRTQPISAGTPINPQFWTQKISAYAEPSCFSGMILGTEGHMAEGTSENPMPSIIIRNMATGVWLRNGTENNAWTAISSNDPSIIILAPLPFLSYIFPNKGVRRIVPNGRRAGISPAISAFTPNLLTIRSEAYFRKGNTDE